MTGPMPRSLTDTRVDPAQGDPLNGGADRSADAWSKTANNSGPAGPAVAACTKCNEPTRSLMIRSRLQRSLARVIALCRRKRQPRFQNDRLSLP
jgi:hypothetical protein